MPNTPPGDPPPTGSLPPGNAPPPPDNSPPANGAQPPPEPAPRTPRPLTAEERGLLDGWLRVLKPEMLRWALVLVHNMDEAEEAVQVVLGLAVMHFPKLLKMGLEPGSDRRRQWYLNTAIQNHLRSCWRRKKRGVIDFSSVDPFPSVEADPNDIPEWRCVSDEHLMDAIRQLPRKQRIAMEHRLNGDSYAEIAGKMAVTTSAVGVSLLRARERMQKQLRRVLRTGGKL